MFRPNEYNLCNFDFNLHSSNYYFIKSKSVFHQMTTSGLELATFELLELHLSLVDKVKVNTYRTCMIPVTELYNLQSIINKLKKTGYNVQILITIYINLLIKRAEWSWSFSDCFDLLQKKSSYY